MMSPLGIFTADDFEKKMVLAHKLIRKVQMKYYLNIKKIRLMCHTARETAWGQICFFISQRQWMGHNIKQKGEEKWLNGSGQPSHLPSLFSQKLCEFHCQLLSVGIYIIFNMHNEFVYWWKVCTTFGPKYWLSDANQHNIDVLITVCKHFYISCATKSRHPRLASFF
jgi:hypothetical protein